MLKRLYDGDIVGVHGEIEAKGVPPVFEIWEKFENIAKLYLKYIMW